MKFTETYENLPKIVKIILQVFLGAIVGAIYRILRYVENKNVITLVVGILCFFPPFDFAAWIIDLVTEITKNRITVLAD